MNVIFDCNTLVSALILKGSNARESWEIVKKNGVILVSENTFWELNDVFLRPKFDKYLKLGTRLELVSEIRSVVKFVSVYHTVKACRDVDDNMYLELALSGNADCIITGDLDLLALNPFENIPIISPKEFLDRYQ